MLPVAMPGAPSSDALAASSFLLLVVRMLLVAMPGAPRSDALAPILIYFKLILILILISFNSNSNLL